jgi:23S rRNA (pseudouridine1915-N3)-methyltransferase
VPWTVLAVGKLRSGALLDLQQDLLKRFKPPLRLIECEAKDAHESKRKELEAAVLRSHMPKQSLTVALDEQGQHMTSMELASLLQAASRPCAFVLGGAEGLHPSLLEACDLRVCLGRFTWPHMWARLMLIEQLYRAQQIHRGHPYHKA